MGIQDRDWYREEQQRKRKLHWNERLDEMEFDRPKARRRWRWPYRLRPDLPYWVTEWIRAAVFFGALGLLYLAWTHFRP
jgi:hypothetical protein